MNNGCLELYNSFTEVVRLEKPGAGIEADDAATDMKVVIGSVSALVASFTYQFAGAMFTLLAPLYFVIGLHLSPTEIGIEFTVLGLGTLIFEPLWGILTDRVPNSVLRPTIAVSSSAAFVALASSRSFLTIAGVVLAIGGLVAGMAVVQRSEATKGVEGHRRGGTLGVLGSVVSASRIAGILAGGFVFSELGFVLGFYIAATLAAVSSLPMLVSPLRQTDNLMKAKEKLDDRRPLPKLKVLSGSAIAIGAFVGQTVMTSLIVIVMARSPVSATPLEIAVMLATYNLSVMIFQPIIGFVGMRRADSWIAAGLCVGMVAYATLVFARSPMLFYVSALTGGLAFSALTPLNLASFISLGGKSREGTMIGAYGAAEDVGVTIGPFVFGFLLGSAGVTSAYLSVVAIYAIVFAFFVCSRLLRSSNS